MKLRALLFVPGDRPERIAKAQHAGADALILDLEDAVVPQAKPAARAHVRAALEARPRPVPLFVRINPLEGPYAADDLAAVLAAPPDGLVLPKAAGRDSIAALDARLGVHTDLPVLPIATETPAAMFALGTYREVAARLCGLTWGAEDLPAALGASTAREPDGRYTPPYELARSLTLYAAAAAGVPAIETVYPAYRDLDGLAAYAARARRDGYSGMLAIHPDQVPVIHAAFRPTAAEIEHARAVVALFAAHPGAGALPLDGRMVDAPHLALARRLLAGL